MPRFTYFLIVAFLFVSRTVIAQESMDIRFERIDNSSGLSNNYVSSICKDHLGFIWVGTSHGLCRIESKDRIKIITMSDDNSLKSNYIRALLSDSKGNLWIGTRLGGLTRFNQKTEEWKTFLPDKNDPNSLSNNEVLSLLEDNQGRVWVGTENGLNLYQEESENFINFLPDVTKENALQTKAILCLEQDSENRIWLGTWGGGMYLVLPSSSNDMAATSFRNFNLNSNSEKAKNVWQIYQDNDERIWVGTFGAGMFLMQLPENVSDNPKQQNWSPKFHNYLSANNASSKISDNVVYDFAQDEKGDLWISTGLGINIVRVQDLPEKLAYNKISKQQPDLKFNKHYYQSNNYYSIPHNSGNCMQIDDQGILWVGTQAGIGSHVPEMKVFEKYTIGYGGKKNSSAQNMYIDRDNIAWIALGNEGLTSYDLNTGKFDKLNKLRNQNDKSTFVSSLFSKDGESLYAGTNDGFEIIDMQNLSSQRFRIPDQLLQTVKYFYYQNLFVDSQDRVWMATDQGIIVYYSKDEQFHIYKHDITDPHSLSDNSTTQVFEASDGTMWISTFNGLNRIESIIDHKIKFIQYKQISEDPSTSVKCNQISAICEKNGKLYLGTGTGMESYDLKSKKFEKEFSDKEQFYYIGFGVFDDKYIWATTTEGLIRMDLKNNRFYELSNADGLMSINFLLRSVVSGPDGKIYLGVSDGFLGLDNDNIRFNGIAPPVYITDVTMMNGNSELVTSGIEKGKIKLRHDDYYIKLNFAALNFCDPEKNQFAYRLKGFDESWVYTTNNKATATYTNLDPGKYSFEVKAANNDGVWNEKGVQLELDVPFALYETVGFQFCALMSLLLGAIFGVKFYNKRLRISNKEMEKLVSERTKELASKNKQVEVLLHEIQKRNTELEEVVERRTERLNESNKDLIRSNKDLEQFAYVASHDLQEPLRTIGSFANILGRKYRGKLDENAYEYLDFIIDGVARMSTQIKSILAYSKVGKKQLEVQMTNLNTVIDLKLFDLSQKISERNAKVKLAKLPEINCEKEHIGMLFYNLINNGIKFNKKENPTIEIACHEDAPEGFWKFSVSDNGIGIAPQFQDQIFEIFRRLNLKTEYKGTGIGLALCKKIVNRHGGKIWIESELEVGTTFFFTIRKEALENLDNALEKKISANLN